MSAFWLEQERRKNARKLVNIEIKAGRVSRRPCAVCGELRADAHHEDYDRPLDVVFLCASHHQLRHQELRGRRDHGVWQAIGAQSPVVLLTALAREKRERPSLAHAVLNGAARRRSA